MDGQVPPLRIRDFETQNVKKFLDKERPRDQRGFGNYGDTRPHRNDLVSSDRYNKSVDVILESIGLGRYVSNFRAYDIGVNILIHMNEEDLAEIGITDFLDQTLFKKQMVEYRGGKGRGHRTVYRVEEDLIMAQNVLTHLEDINTHLNVVKHYLKKNDFEDYYISSRKSILAVFNLVINQALIQTKKMSDVLFTGSLDSDELIPALLNFDSLDLPEFMVAKLYKPDKFFRVKPKKPRPTMKIIKTVAAFSVGVTAMAALICKCYIKK